MASFDPEFAYIVPDTAYTSIPMDWAEYFAKSGHQFTLVVLWDQDDLTDSRLQEFKQFENVDVIEFELDHTGEILFRIRALERLAARLSSVHVIHTHHVIDSLVGMYLSYRLDVSHVISNHAEFDLLPFRKRLVMYMPLKSGIPVFNSVKTMESFGTLATHSTHSQVIYNGIMTDDIDEVAAARTDKSYLARDFELNVAMASRFTEVKDLKTALRAFEELQNSDVEIGLHLAGSGPKKTELLDFIASHDLTNVKYYGYLSRDEVYELFLSTDVFALTSRSEGFCNALVEAMYCRNAVVSTDIRPITTEIVGEDGFYFDVGDHEQLKDVLLRLSRKPDLVNRKKTKSRKLAEQYDIERTIDDYLDLYESVSVA